MTTRQVVIGQDDFSGGMNRNAAPHRIPENAVWDVLNGLLDDEGSVYRRGGTVNKSAEAFGSEGLTFVWDGYFDAGRRTLFANADDFAVLDTDDETVINLGGDGLAAPAAARLIESSLFIGGGYIYAGSRMSADYTTGTISTTNGSKTVTGSGTTWNTLVDEGMLLQVGNERVYPVASIDSTTELTLRDDYVGTTDSGKNYTLTPLYEITALDPYEDADYYAVAGNRLLVGSGDVVKFTPVRNPHSFATNDFHRIPGGEKIIALESLGNFALIFTTHGIWTLDGLAYDIVDADGNPQHRLQQLSKELVLYGSAGIASWEQTLVVPCTDGIYLIDGISTPVRISDPITDYYTDYVQQGYGAGQAVVFRGHYFLPILSGVSCIDMLVCRLDAPEQMYPWSHFADAGGEMTAYAIRHSETVRDPILLGAEARESSRIVIASGYFDPAVENKNDADGSTHNFRVVTRDFETGDGTENSVRFNRLRYELEDAGTDDPTIEIDYGIGVRSSTAAEWGHPDGLWGTGFGPAVDGSLQPWGSETDAEFFDPGCSAPEDSEGTTPYRCRIGRRARYMRFRYRSDDPAARMILRSSESFIRPSRAVRR